MLTVNRDDEGMEELALAIEEQVKDTELRDFTERVYVWGASKERPHEVYICTGVPQAPMIKKFFEKKGFTVAYSSVGRDCEISVGLRRDLRVPLTTKAVQVVLFLVHLMAGKVIWKAEDYFDEAVKPFETSKEFLKWKEKEAAKLTEGGFDTPRVRNTLQMLAGEPHRLREVTISMDGEHATARGTVIGSRGNTYIVEILTDRVTSAVLSSTCQCIGYRTHGVPCRHINVLGAVTGLGVVREAMRQGIEITLTHNGATLVRGNVRRSVNAIEPLIQGRYRRRATRIDGARPEGRIVVFYFEDMDTSQEVEIRIKTEVRGGVERFSSAADWKIIKVQHRVVSPTSISLDDLFGWCLGQLARGIVIGNPLASGQPMTLTVVERSI